jgi:hypothetical protein
VKDKGIENILNIVIEEYYPNLERQTFRYRKFLRHPGKQDQKKTTTRHIIIKMLSAQNKERILKKRQK